MYFDGRNFDDHDVVEEKKSSKRKVNNKKKDRGEYRDKDMKPKKRYNRREKYKSQY